MSAFHARHEGLLDAAQLDKAYVTLIGAGSVGSVLAMLLVRSGVQHLRLLDMDTVAETNLCRTVFVRSDIGRLKVDALADHLRAIREGVEVEPLAVDVQSLDDEELEIACCMSNVVVAVTDHPGVQARVGAISYPIVPAVFAGVYERGVGGEVLWTAPGETPCYACVLGAIRDANAPARPRHAYGLTTGQTEAVPALGIDIAHVTVLAAKIALALLLRGTSAPATQILDPARSVLFVGNAVDWIWREPFETVWARAKRRERCLCRLAPGASTADLLDPPESA